MNSITPNVFVQYIRMYEVRSTSIHMYIQCIVWDRDPRRRQVCTYPQPSLTYICTNYTSDVLGRKQKQGSGRLYEVLLGLTLLLHACLHCYYWARFATKCRKQPHSGGKYRPKKPRRSWLAYSLSGFRRSPLNEIGAFHAAFGQQLSITKSRSKKAIRVVLP